MVGATPDNLRSPQGRLKDGKWGKTKSFESFAKERSSCHSMCIGNYREEKQIEKSYENTSSDRQ